MRSTCVGRAIWWWDKTVASLGWDLIVKCRPSPSKLRVDPQDPSEGVSLLGPKVGCTGPKVGCTACEAGFTEQRKPPSPDSGGITGCCNHCPVCQLSLVSVDHHIFIFFMNSLFPVVFKCLKFIRLVVAVYAFFIDLQFILLCLVLGM